jgi:hypothetical protein
VLGRDPEDAVAAWDDATGKEAAEEEASAAKMFDGEARKPAA